MNKNKAGQFQKVCGASCHKGEKTQNLIKIKCRSFSKRTRDALINKSVITMRTTYICKACVSACVECLEEGEPPVNIIKKDILYLKKRKLTFKDLMTYNPDIWLGKRPKELVEALKSLFRLPTILSKQQTVSLCYGIEQLYGCVNSRLILPISFSKNLLTHQLTRCKQVVVLNSKTSPAGSYQFILNWCYNQSSFLAFPMSDVKAMFDNEQKVGRTWQMKPNSTCPMSVITTHGQIVLTTKKQYDESLKPKYWLFKCNNNNNNNNSRLGDDNFFRVCRDEFLQLRLENLFKSPDSVDRIVNEKIRYQNVKFCMSCGHENDVSYRTCRVCLEGTLKKRKYTIESNEPGP